MATAGSSSSNSNSEMVPNRIFVGGIPLDVINCAFVFLNDYVVE